MSYKYSENTMRAEIDRITRELAEAKARAIPDGWVAVPAEPTPEMIKAMNNDEWPALFQFECQEIYAAMLSARPDPKESSDVE